MQRVRVPHPVALPLSIPGDWLEAHRGLDGTKLGVGGGTVVGFVVSEGFIYAYHRTAHRIDFMWRAFHQLHHSPNRVDIPGSVLFHPLEVVAQVVINLFATVIVLGLDPLAAALVGYLIAFCDAAPRDDQLAVPGMWSGLQTLRSPAGEALATSGHLPVSDDPAR